jgi:hypothetical protein
LKRLLLLSRRFRKNSFGISGILSIVILVIIVLFLYANVFVFVFRQNSSYQEGITEINENEEYRNREKIIFSGVKYGVVDDQVCVELQVTNDGPISVQLVNFWVMDKTIQGYGYNDTVDIHLKTGDTMDFSGSNALRVLIDGSISSNSFTSWFVTERGNILTLEEEEELIVAQVAQGIGDLALEFEEFRYFPYASERDLANYPNGIKSFDIPKNTYVTFGCYVTNLNILKQTIIIDSHSIFWQPGRSAVAEGAWFIVNVAENGTINPTFSQISINYGETKMLVFASQNDLGVGSFSRVRTPNSATTVATFLLLHGTKGSTAFAQNIPFVSLYYN